MLGLAAAGIWISVGRHAFATDDSELPLYDFVRAHRTPGDVYLIPVRIPQTTGRGSLSSDFKALADKQQDTRVLPLDLDPDDVIAGSRRMLVDDLVVFDPVMLALGEVVDDAAGRERRLQMKVEIVAHRRRSRFGRNARGAVRSAFLGLHLELAGAVIAVDIVQHGEHLARHPGIVDLVGLKGFRIIRRAPGIGEASFV